MSEFYKPSEEEVRKKAEVDFSGCNLEVAKQKQPLELHEQLQIAFDQMSPEEREAHGQYFVELSEFYNGPGGP